MKNKKTTVGILFGGMSAEHEVSLKSAAAVYKNLDREKFIPTLVYIGKKGRWSKIDEDSFKKGEFPQSGGSSFIPWQNDAVDKIEADIYFPVLHGPNGEDGKIQGLFEMAGKPYVGADSFSSALAMDKGVAKFLFQKAGLKTPGFLLFTQNDGFAIKEQVEEKLFYPVFVKPCSLGSSVGISKAKNEGELQAAVDLAFKYDRKIIIELGLDAREIELSVMGNEEILVSPPGELNPGNEFYDYADKYLNGKTTFSIPAELEEQTVEKLQNMARKAFQALYLNGMSRVDFFIEKESGAVYINEINTIPGFTEISMFPKLWTVVGISFTQLVTRLIEYGFQYHDSR
ncbi:MAG: D-alanine--D-alanine ligase [Candidatus Aminicenantes bacterium]|nr:D-alanine--D-alanine ligase [Candidatus Aminicenantes bacterium]